MAPDVVAGIAELGGKAQVFSPRRWWLARQNYYHITVKDKCSLSGGDGWRDKTTTMLLLKAELLSTKCAQELCLFYLYYLK